MQLTLGQLISQLEELSQEVKQFREFYNYEPRVYLDFGNMVPGRYDSYRGDYSALALSYDEHVEPYSYSEFLEETRECVGPIFYGYKGGEFIMSLETPLWVANYGESTDTAVVGVTLSGIRIIIHTKYIEPMEASKRPAGWKDRQCPSCGELI